MTPMMEQYTEIKARNADAILLFRLGDFYEMFFEDAKIAAKELEIALTQREMGEGERAPMCGVPHHSSDPYIAKLVAKGYKVAICEQLEDPKVAKGIVKRDVVRVITPGTVIDAQASKDDNNHLLCVQLHATGFSCSAVDIQTGELSSMQYNDPTAEVYPLLLDEIARWQPAELLVSDSLYAKTEFIQEMTERYNCMISVYDAYSYDHAEQVRYIQAQIRDLEKNHAVFEHPISLQTLHALLRYIYQFEKSPLKHLRNLNWYELDVWMRIDQNTRAHLDIQKNQRTLDAKNTLFSVLHHTRTAMGTRKLHQFLERPLRSEPEIQRRLDTVASMVDHAEIRLRIGSLLDGVHDLDRLLAKLSYQRANARDLLALASSLANVEKLKAYLASLQVDALQLYANKTDPLDDIRELIESSIAEDPPILITDGGIIRIGYNEELDALRDTSLKGQDLLIAYEAEQRESTGIKNLKIVYHKNKGYFLDVTKSHIEKVPDSYERIQTLTNSERYSTSELMQIQRMIQDSSEETKELEYSLFQEIRTYILDQAQRIQLTSSLLATLDVFYSFAHAAVSYDYIRPEFRKDRQLRIEEGRHPVVERSLPEGSYVHNDTDLGRKGNVIQVITGPNMAGKSTYMRQVALIVLMAQIGSFVPAKSASIGMVDQIFTRIGASDHLTAGDSTFMVEMKEMSYILTHATKNSLLILDEIGRGTSTFDGMSIAWAIIEHIASELKVKTLFATHYHELTALSDHYDDIRNMTIAVREELTQIVFLRKIMPGQTDRSYGIEVAKMAGFPATIIARAAQVLQELERHRKDITVSSDLAGEEEYQMNLHEIELKQFVSSIRSIDVESTTPMEALMMLERLRTSASELGEIF